MRAGAVAFRSGRSTNSQPQELRYRRRLLRRSLRGRSDRGRPDDRERIERRSHEDETRNPEQIREAFGHAADYGAENVPAEREALAGAAGKCIGKQHAREKNRQRQQNRGRESAEGRHEAEEGLNGDEVRRGETSEKANDD